jgi:hypothetical protein
MQDIYEEQAEGAQAAQAAQIVNVLALSRAFVS